MRHYGFTLANLAVRREDILCRLECQDVKARPMGKDANLANQIAARARCPSWKHT